MLYNVFDTEAEALTAEAVAYAAHIEAHTNPEYRETTTRWAIPQQRLDGKWVFPVCEHCSESWTEEEYSSDWFPETSG